MGLDTPAHIFGDDDPSCPLAAHEPIFRQMLASLWFCRGVPLLGGLNVSMVPRDVCAVVGYCSGFVAVVKPARDAVPWTSIRESSAHERFQVQHDKIKEHQSTTARRADRQGAAHISASTGPPQ